MITDKMRELVTTYIKDTLINRGDVGLGGNTTSPAATTLDVGLGVNVTPSVVATSSNTFEVKLSIAGTASAISGKVIREASIQNTGNLLARVNFDGIGPFASNETLELFFIIEVE
tara:strand:- start:5412 stop:5756 length:345 start_codon:yes stop_codon:yes gene_type:complete